MSQHTSDRQLLTVRAAIIVGGVTWLVLCVIYACVRLEAEDEKYLSDLRDRTAIEALNVSERLSGALDGMQNIAEAFAKEPEAISLLQHRLAGAAALAAIDEAHRRARLAGDPETVAMSEYYRQIVDDTNYDLVYLLDAKGTCIASSNWLDANSLLGGGYGDRGYFRRAVASGGGWEFTVGRLVKVPSFFFARAIHAGGVVVGAAVVRKNAETLASTVTSHGNETLVVQTDGVVVASNRPDLILRHIALWDRGPLPGSDYGPRPLRELSILPDATHPPFNLVTWNGIRYLVARQPLTHGPVEVWIAAPLDSRAGAYWASVEQTFYAGLAGLLVLFLIERTIARALLLRVHGAEIAKANEALTAANALLTSLARTDSLTGCANRRYFIERVGESIAQARRSGQPTTLIILDLDHFKRINDAHGHPVGDDVLAKAARACLDLVRTTDVFGRIGGEEFALLLWDTDAAGAWLLAERLRTAIEALEIHHGSAAIRVTASFGLAELLPGEGFEGLYSRADAALYAAKTSGRNRIVAA